MFTVHPRSARACVIFNPTARGERARRLVRHLSQLGLQCAFKPTLAAGDARNLAAEAVREGFETVVAVGGDGTVNEVLNGLADEPDGLPRVRLGVLPVGTVNVFARELGIPFRFEKAWEIICRGRETWIDLPQLEFETSQGHQSRFFAQMAGCGLDARAVELVEWEQKKRMGQFAYVMAGIKALREPRSTLRIADGSREVTGQLVLIGNGRFYAGSIPIFHRADLRDGKLDICVFPRVNWFVIMRYACAYVSSRLLFRGTEYHFQSNEVTVQSMGRAPVELDGEPVGQLPVRGTIRPGALRVIVPS
jgi:diacylglycerol kinase (ATP)